MNLSVIVVNYNTKRLLEECLKSIYEETRGIEFEVIVVDNNSTDGSRQMLVDVFPHTIKIFNDTNQGFASANNQGFRIAKGAYLLMLNSDTIVLDGALQKVVAFMRSHPQARITGCKLLNSDRSLQGSAYSFPTVWNLFLEATFLYLLSPKSKAFGPHHMPHLSHDALMQVDWVTGAFLMFDRKILTRLDGLDETFFMYGEETDFCFRAAREGFQSWFFPGADVIHHRFGSATNHSQRLKNLTLGQAIFFKRHYAPGKRVTLMFLLLSGRVVRIVIYFASGLLSANRDLIRKSADTSASVFSLLHYLFSKSV